MEKATIMKAAQLTDDLKKVNRAMGLFEFNEPIAVRLSVNLGEESKYAYLPKSIVPAIYTLLAEAKDYITKEMEEL